MAVSIDFFFVFLRKESKGEGSAGRKKSTSRHSGSSSDGDCQDDDGEEDTLTPIAKASKTKMEKLDTPPPESSLAHPDVAVSASSSPQDVVPIRPSAALKPSQRLAPIQTYRTQGYQTQLGYSNSQAAAMSHSGYGQNYYTAGYTHMAPAHHSPNMAVSMQMPSHTAALGAMPHPQMGFVSGGQAVHHPSSMGCSPYQTMLSHPMQGPMGVGDPMAAQQMGLGVPVPHPMTDVVT